MSPFSNEEWETRHEVTSSARLRTLRSPKAAVTLGASVALTVLDAYQMFYSEKLDRYATAPYVLEDKKGEFQFGMDDLPWYSFSPKFYKEYVSGGSKGKKESISFSEFRRYKGEAEALYGTTDWKGDFVPGLLMPTLPVQRPLFEGLQDKDAM